MELTGGWPKRAGGMLFAPDSDGSPLWIHGADEMFGWIGGRVSNPASWATGTDKPTKAEFTAHIEQSVEAFDAVEAFPHYPPLPRIYYLHPAPQGGNGEALGELVKRFKPQTHADYDLIIAFFLTLFWGGMAGPVHIHLLIKYALMSR